MKKNESNKKQMVDYDKTPLEINEKYGTVFYLVRHGQSIGNAKREFLGHTDKDLSPLGYVQAERTADFLSEAHIDVIYSSDLIRAYNTALPHARQRSLEVNSKKELRELYAGSWEGMRVEDIISRYPHEFLDHWRANFGLTTIPEGESVQDGANRFFEAVKEIAEANRGKKILIAAHAAVIRGFWGKITKTPPEELAVAFDYPTNASVSVFYFDGENLIPGEYSHDAHLKDLEGKVANGA